MVVDLDEDSCTVGAGRRPLRAVERGGGRAAGGVVAFVTSAVPSAEALAASLGEELAASTRRRGRGGGRLAAGLDVRAGDLRAVKARASAFFPGNCDLPDRLRERGVRDVLVVGLATNICCESTARAARARLPGHDGVRCAHRQAGPARGLAVEFFRIFGDVGPAGGDRHAAQPP